MSEIFHIDDFKHLRVPRNNTPNQFDELVSNCMEIPLSEDRSEQKIGKLQKLLNAPIHADESSSISDARTMKEYGYGTDELYD